MENEIIQFKKLKENKNDVSIYYLGQEGVLINLNGKTFCVDPYLTDYVDKNCCTEIIKWNRLYESKIKGQDLDFVDYFLFTHTHYDHCDPWTIRDILSTNKTAKFIISSVNIKSLIEYGAEESRIIPASVHKSIDINEVKISSYPAKHDIFHKIGNEYAELCFSLSANGFKIFHAGDTLKYPKLVKYMDGSDICFLPINGRDKFRTKNDVIGNLNAKESFKIAYKSHSKLLVPIHNDLYSVNRCSDEELNKAMNKYRKIRCVTLTHDNILKVDI